jgi:hypothetical protein
VSSAPWVQQFHSLGLGSEILAPADATHLMEVARQRSGLADFGDSAFVDALGLVLETIDNAPISLLGRMIKLEEVLRYLTGRLMLEDLLKRTPEILDEKIEKPIFIVSLPRAGSSILFELMSRRQGLRYLKHWEAVEPCPPPHPDSYATDPRIAANTDWIESWNRIAPDYPSRHLIGPTVPVECITAMGFSFVSAQFGLGVDEASYHLAITSEQWVQSYEYYKRVLQTLQFNFADKQWLLKSPAHLFTLPELVTAFPDAQIVFIHRDPITTVASTASVVTTLNADVFGAPFDPAAYLSSSYLPTLGFVIGHMIDTYDRAVAQGGTVVNVLYKDLMDDPVTQVARIYDEIGIGTTPADTDAISSHLKERPKGKYGGHSYSLPDEVDVHTFRQRVAPYMEKFGVPEE